MILVVREILRIKGLHKMACPLDGRTLYTRALHFTTRSFHIGFDTIQKLLAKGKFNNFGTILRFSVNSEVLMEVLESFLWCDRQIS